MQTTYPGINYAGPGQTTNMNAETGIRYGVISTHDVNPDAIEDVYCNGLDRDYEDWQEAIKDAIRSALSHYLSERAIEHVIDTGLDDIGDDYQSTGDCTRYAYESDGYKLQIDSSGDLWVLKSPYFTFAQFCSPCAPGACHLGNPLDLEKRPFGDYAANRCYCLGHDWFDGDKAPYTVYSVADGSIVQPAAQEHAQ